MVINYNKIQKLLKSRADLHARLNLIPYDGTPKIKERGVKYLYVRKCVAGKLTSTYVRVIPKNFITYYFVILEKLEQ